MNEVDFYNWQENEMARMIKEGKFPVIILFIRFALLSARLLWELIDKNRKLGSLAFYYKQRRNPSHQDSISTAESKK